MSAARLRTSLALLGRAAKRQQQQQQVPPVAALALALAAAADGAAAPPQFPRCSLLALPARGAAAPLPLVFALPRGGGGGGGAAAGGAEISGRRRAFSSEAAAAASASAPPPAASSDNETNEDFSHLPPYTLAQVALRDGLSTPDAWLAIDGLVYDATPYLDEHPGGSDIIVLNAGTDASAEFAAVHTPAAREVLQRFLIGRLVQEEEGAAKEEAQGAEAAEAAAEAAGAAAAAAAAVALDPRRRVPLKLVSRWWVSPTSVLLRFALPGGAGQRAGVPTGQHVMVYLREPVAARETAAGGDGGEAGGGEAAAEEGALVARAYTPVSRDEDGGALELLVRVYRPNARFPAGGRLSQLLADAVPVEEGGVAEEEAAAAAPTTAPPSSSSSSSTPEKAPNLGPPFPRVEFKGPVGHFRYLGSGGLFSLANAPPRRASRLLLVAGGSGITPCYQVLRAALDEWRQQQEAGQDQQQGANAPPPPPPPRVALVYGSPCPEEILLREELEALARAFPPPAFSLHLTVDRVPGPPEREAEWRAGGGGVGFVTREALERHGFSGRGGEEGEGEGEGDRLALVCGPPPMLEHAVVPALKAMGFDGDRLVLF